MARAGGCVFETTAKEVLLLSFPQESRRHFGASFSWAGIEAGKYSQVPEEPYQRKKPANLCRLVLLIFCKSYIRLPIALGIENLLGTHTADALLV
jgi:hypothetical protein